MAPTWRGPAVPRLVIRHRVRGARLAADMSQAELARRMDWAPSKILRIENGQSGVSTSDLKSLFAELGIVDFDEEYQVALARGSKRSGPDAEVRDLVPSEFAMWLDFETSAAKIRQCETAVVPGLLQTTAYARAMVTAFVSGLSDDEVNRIVHGRVIARAEPLRGADGPHMQFIIDEAALRRIVGTTRGDDALKTMIEQLRRLQHYNTVGRIACGESIEPELNPRIAIQVVPFAIGAYVAMDWSFAALQFDEAEVGTMIYFENPTGGVLLRDDTAETQPYLDHFLDLQAAIAGPEETNRLIDQIIEMLTSGRNGLPFAERTSSA